MQEYEGKPVIVFAQPVEHWPHMRVLDFRTLNFASLKHQRVQHTYDDAMGEAKATQDAYVRSQLGRR